MKSDIILLTIYYPFSETSEIFINPELHAIDYNKWHVRVITTSQEKMSEVKQDCPPDVQIECIGRPAFSILYKIYLFSEILINKQVYKEIYILKRQKRCSFKNIKKLLYFCANAFDKYNSMIRLLKKYGYIAKGKKTKDLMLYSFWMNASAYAAAMLSEKYGFPAICRVHGMDLYDERNSGYLPMRYYTIQQMNRIYAASNAGRAYLIHKYGNEKKIQCSYLGSENFFKQRLINSRTPFRIVSCAYVIPLKRIESIAEAICGIEDIEIEWIHFGGGSNLPLIIQIVESAKSNIKCHLMGNVSSKQIMEFYHQNDVHLFVNFSTTEGGVPQSIKEAMSFGIPVVATNVGGNPEIIRDHINGYLLNVDSSVEQLRNSLIEFTQMTDKEYLRYRIEAFNEWDKHFNAQAIVPKLYEDMARLLM